MEGIPSMNVEEDLATELSYFGLDKTDSKMYLGLLRIGSLTVGKISTKLEIDRGKAYRSLNKLRDMGLITTTFSKYLRQLSSHRLSLLILESVFQFLSKY